MSKGGDKPYPFPEPEVSFVAEAAARYDMPQRQMQRALSVVLRLIPEELALLEELATLEDVDQEHRRQLVRGLQGAVESYRQGGVEEDPLSEVDTPMSFEDEVESTVWAELEAGKNRARLLRQCVSAGEAGRLTGRSRQAVERQRRDGRLLALRVGRRWRYPAWQFDVDGPGGIVPGLPEVVAHLQASPAGAAHWLTHPQPGLGGEAPIRLLQKRAPEPVLSLAEQLGYLP